MSKSLWKLVEEKQRTRLVYSITRQIYNDDSSTNTRERYPLKHYSHIRHDEEALKLLVDRLNYEIERVNKAVQLVTYKHAFINDELKQEFKALLIAQIPSKDRALYLFHYLEKHFLTFFIQALNLANPEDWYAVHKTKWADYLIKNTEVAAPASKRDVIQVANRFMKYLHEKRMNEVALYSFAPISSAKFKQMAAKWKLDHKGKRKAISDEHWEIIVKALPTTSIYGLTMLAKTFGLRRAECLGITLGNVKNGVLVVEKQLMALYPEKQYEPLKGREARKVPYWYGTPAHTYEYVQNALMNSMHPDTLSDRWRSLMTKLGLDYDFHDLRHTFITKAITSHDHREVQLAAGHKNIETTMGYAHDDRALDEAEFIPKKTG